MNFSPARWAGAVAAAALIALPGSALAQTTPPQNPPPQPPAQTQPAAAPSQNGQADPAVAKQHLTEARDSLAQLTSMPEASKLQGDARNQVSQLISNFNAMITTQSDWRAGYAKVNESLTALLGPDNDPGAAAGTTGTPGAPGTAGTAGTTGTTGTTGTAAKPDPASPAGATQPAGATELDPAIRAKLVEFRTHLKEFEKAAGGASAPTRTTGASGTPGATGTTGTSGATAPTGTTGTAPATGASDAAAASGSTSASGSSSASNPPSASNPSNPSNPPMNPAEGSTPAASAAAGAAGANGLADQKPSATPQSELAAIDAILAGAKTGGLTKEQTAELQRHVDALRVLLIQK